MKCISEVVPQLTSLTPKSPPNCTIALLIVDPKTCAFASLKRYPSSLLLPPRAPQLCMIALPIVDPKTCACASLKRYPSSLLLPPRSPRLCMIALPIVDPKTCAGASLTPAYPDHSKTQSMWEVNNKQKFTALINLCHSF